MPDTKTTATQSAGRSVVRYTSGFILSVCLTLVAYGLVVRGSLSSPLLIAAILLLACIQFAVQLVFFLHLGTGRNQRWNLVSFAFMIMVLGIIVFGSLWIMRNLDYHMLMSPENLDTYIREDEGIYNQ